MSQEKKTDCLTIHPEHDKVSSAILGALVRLGNAPSSPKELANTIMKHKLTTLDGQQSFTTVSSCISQYLKKVEPATTTTATTNHANNFHCSLNPSRTSNDMVPIVNNTNTTLIPKQPYKIVKILIGNMECYQLNDDDQIKVLRFIELTQPDDQIARLKQGYINATHLRRAAVPVLGEGVFDTQKETVVVITNGPVESRGAW
ncbi:hypothetical protein EDC94DRAFT_76877 [Helicostylum pulchrum]|nr:hypothetical protein EDC94DRAFT_76877 [Helicostylum pulchrum]